MTLGGKSAGFKFNLSQARPRETVSEERGGIFHPVFEREDPCVLVVAMADRRAAAQSTHSLPGQSGAIRIII